MTSQQVAPKSLYVTLELPVSDAPEVKGSTSWITPQRAEWTVSTVRFPGGHRIATHVSVTLTGPNRKGKWSGRVGYEDDCRWREPIPSWLPVPSAWIDAATALVDAHAERVEASIR